MVQLLERYPNLETVVVSDTDTVWLRDPQDYLAKHPAADWFASTDCLSHAVSVLPRRTGVPHRFMCMKRAAAVAAD